MTITETSAAPIRRPADTSTETEKLRIGTRVAVWAGLAAVGALFWLGVWKAVELAF